MTSDNLRGPYPPPDLPETGPMLVTLQWRLAQAGGKTLELRYDNAHPYRGADITLDGTPFDVGYIQRLRDGGTTKFNLTMGGQKHLLVLHRSIRLKDAGQEYESFDGERLERV
jgi:hypothetical protein